MKISSEILLSELIEKTKSNLNQAEKFKQLSKESLNYKHGPESWSVLECMKHLNLYGEYYLPEIEAKMDLSNFKSSVNFTSGLLGNYFANIMLPSERLKKMKSPKDKNPVGSTLDLVVIEEFISQQYKLLDLLNQARKVNLTKTKTAISISKIVKLKLGDTLRFVINHNERHIKQANKVLSEIPK